MKSADFDRVLVANRGEIACRVLRSAHDRGYRTVAVYSDADVDSRHVRLADRAVRIGPAAATNSYLDIEAVIDAARKSGADAVHPGYGFLAENAAFAEAVEAAGLVFIGPPPEAIRVMGNKRLAKIRMAEAGVPCVPGYSGGEQTIEALTDRARDLGVPLMIKASAGGGGRGLRLVRRLEDLPAQLAVARSEAEASFGDGELILERAIERPRHVEVQVVADQRGRVVHLFERDCSVQRRHQKILEEAPCPAVDHELRRRLGATAVAAAEAVNYVGAGTVEMLLGADGAFYFMEMNTRLQVEHPVTEMITGLDLVALQLDIAAGHALPFTQEDLRFEGHAIEARIYAEDADHGFLPQTGRVRRWRPAEGSGIRVDHGLDEGTAVTADYDAMVAKVIAHGKTREEARRRLIRALERTELHGVTTNQSFLLRAVRHPRFARGDVDTGFIEAEMAELVSGPTPAIAKVLAGAALAAPAARRSWSSSPQSNARFLRLEEGGEALDLTVTEANDETEVTVGEGRHTVTIVERRADRLRYRSDGVDRWAAVTEFDGGVEVGIDGSRWTFTVAAPRRDTSAAGGAVVAPMAGTVVDVAVEAGHAVAAGDVIVVLEAMKMQLELTAPRAGRLEDLSVSKGDQVEAKQIVAEIVPDPRGTP